MSNRLKDEKSPYLLQHKDNPVDWYAWCDEAFQRAADEDKPVFLSIGYSACHWCHVFAHESFEDKEIADILNKNFISVKVDREERPDIDSVYMAVCQAFTGSGGWPTSIFMTPDKKPFFAGTYFPKHSQGAMIGFRELLLAIDDKWKTERTILLGQAQNIIDYLKSDNSSNETADQQLLEDGVNQLFALYDKKNGGFGKAPKFPTPHNLLFLLSYYERYKNNACLQMAEHTLMQMYRGGIFDHIGFGFCRYSTDAKYLVPHFEKMLYDNALLILAYCKAYAVTKNEQYLAIAEKTAAFVFREMCSDEGGFYSALDADSEGEEGKYYLFTPQEIDRILKDRAEDYKRYFDITEKGNFEGKNIPNLLKNDPSGNTFADVLDELRRYRENRSSLHLDDKILTAWNSLMIAAMCELYLHSHNEKYLHAAKKADAFIKKYLCDAQTLFVSFRDGKRGVAGFLDDYAAYIFAQLYLYRATLHTEYLERAKLFCEKATLDFADKEGGFFLYGDDSEELILRPKETYDGAIPSGNALMAYNLVRLSLLTGDEKYKLPAEKQLDFIAADALDYPVGHTMFLTALLEYFKPPLKITVVTDENADISKLLPSLPPQAAVVHLSAPTEAYPLKNNKPTFYVCTDRNCLPPVNDLNELNGVISK